MVSDLFRFIQLNTAFFLFFRIQICISSQYGILFVVVSIASASGVPMVSASLAGHCQWLIGSGTFAR